MVLFCRATNVVHFPSPEAPPMLKVRKMSGSKNYEIVNTATGKVVEGGFFSKDRAEDYMHAEYDVATGAALETSYTGR